MSRKPNERTVASWKQSIAKLGCARIKLRNLIGHFGFERRDRRMVIEVEQWLEGEGI